MTQETTLDFHGAKLIVPTADLIDAWAQRVAASPSAQAVQGSIAPPELQKGEVYLGAFVSAGGQHQHHTILLPFDRDDAPWDEHMAWAKDRGFDLPNRLELLMMWSTMRQRFQQAAYWSNEAHHDDSSYAWCQLFGNGCQGSGRKSAAFRAVAVRRSPIQSFTHS